VDRATTPERPAQLSSVRPEISSGVAVWAHIGGFFAGFVLVKLSRTRRWCVRAPGATARPSRSLVGKGCTGQPSSLAWACFSPAHAIASARVRGLSRIAETRIWWSPEIRRPARPCASWWSANRPRRDHHRQRSRPTRTKTGNRAPGGPPSAFPPSCLLRRPATLASRWFRRRGRLVPPHFHRLARPRGCGTRPVPSSRRLVGDARLEPQSGEPLLRLDRAFVRCAG